MPVEWLNDVKATDEDSLLDLADHLPTEAAEALLELAVGKTPQPSLPAPSGTDPFDHPDALRRFRVMRNVEELEEALEYPWEKWTIFLHPAQLGLVERNYNGPARVSGSAGTGKTVVALHRAAFLAKSNPDARILLTTFSDALANLLRAKFQLLVHQEVQPNGRIMVDSLDAVSLSLYEARFGSPALARREAVESLVEDAASLEDTTPRSGGAPVLPGIPLDGVGPGSGRLAASYVGRLSGCSSYWSLPQVIREPKKEFVAGF